MNPEPNASSGYNPDIYWDSTADSYPHYPTVRHRRRYILRTLRAFPVTNATTVFDFGCGEGTLLQTIQESFRLPAECIGGCDISEQAIENAQKKIRTPHLSHALFPKLSQTFDVMLCSEVIEHTTTYREILQWMADNLSPGGLMVVTTQAGSIHASDRYTGHTQHFDLRSLCRTIGETGLKIRSAKLWGFPFFTLQKYLTDVNFSAVQHQFLEGEMSARKKAVFDAAYALYFVHDIIPWGPQIFVTATKA